jgi:outer membrane protein OmpA-like peptidoglycan-associated protein
MVRLFLYPFFSLSLLVGSSYVSAQPGSSADAKASLNFSPVEGYALRQPEKVEAFGQYLQKEIRCDGGPCQHPMLRGGEFRAEGKIITRDYRNLKTPVGNAGVLRNIESAVKALGGEKINNRADPSFFHLFRIPRGDLSAWLVLKNYDTDAYEVVLIEPVALAQTVKATQMAEEIKNQGFATIYINFDTNKSELKPESKQTISEIAVLLKNDPALKLSVQGHTDNVGNAAANKMLSENRAKSVVQAVVAQGIENARLSYKGFGLEKPIADNKSEDGRAKNRRVELVKQ